MRQLGVQGRKDGPYRKALEEVGGEMSAKPGRGAEERERRNEGVHVLPACSWELKSKGIPACPLFIQEVRSMGMSW